MRGAFITFEGGEGVGKSTQIALLAARLRTDGVRVVETREPGGTPGAEEIRALVVRGAADRWTPKTDALLFMAARADHVARLIRPALARGETVLCDRFLHSTFAYQGSGGVTRADLARLNAFATGGLEPDCVLWLDLPAEEGLRRSRVRAGGEQRFEADTLAFHERVWESFARSAAEDARVRRIDASGSVEDVAAAIWRVVYPVIREVSAAR